MSDIKTNLEHIESRIKKYAQRPVTLLGVTKFQPEEKIKEALRLGVSHLGVNYVQDGEILMQRLENKQVSWHFIGHIQSRKAKLLCPYNLVESLDRIEIAERLDRALDSYGKKMPVLIEVNIGEESSKSGVAPDSLLAFAKSLSQFSRIEVTGLMGMPPPLYPVTERRPFFKKLYSLFEALGQMTGCNTLSMGTSEDFEIALQEGSNLIRLGTLLFGKRTRLPD